MVLEMVLKIPLIKIRKGVTESRLIRLYGDRLCALYSEKTGKYKQGDEWTESVDDAEILTFKEWYEQTKNFRKDGLVYFIVKI